jgi:hypothetical protein
MRLSNPPEHEVEHSQEIVVSTQKLNFSWRNSERLEGELIDAVTALKTTPGSAREPCM